MQHSKTRDLSIVSDFLSVFEVSSHSPLSVVLHVTVHVSVSQSKRNIIYTREKKKKLARLILENTPNKRTSKIVNI